MKEQPIDHSANNGNTRPKNPSANTVPSEGYVLEIDGKFKKEYASSEAAMVAALELKKNIRRSRSACVRRKRTFAHTSRPHRKPAASV